MTDTIAITGLRVFARHGVLDHEEAAGQVFVIDLRVHVDLSEACESDRLDATVDYGTLASRVSALVAGERWDLIERVAQRIADLVLTDPRCEAVDVTVHKPSAPIKFPFGDVAVSISRHR
ncbi:MAG: dihydroneopterin aldolase [Acidimicrobiia bacterium]